jgi:hypothetical protein
MPDKKSRGKAKEIASPQVRLASREVQPAVLGGLGFGLEDMLPGQGHRVPRPVPPKKKGKGK